MINEPEVEVLTAEVGVSTGGEGLVHSRCKLQNGNIKGSATEVVDDDGAVVVAPESVGQSSCCRLVEQALTAQPSHTGSLDGRLALGMVEVSRDRDDSLIDGLSQSILREAPGLSEDAGRDLHRGHALAADDHLAQSGVRLRDLVAHPTLRLERLRAVEATPHQSLDRAHGPIWTGHDETLGGGSDEIATLVGQGDAGREDVVALVVLKHPGSPVTHHRDCGVCRTKVDPDGSSHPALLPGLVIAPRLE